MYQVIKKHSPVVDQYAKKLVNEKVVSEEEYKVWSVVYVHRSTFFHGKCHYIIISFWTYVYKI